MQIPGLGAYAATKAALDKLSATARGELAPENIRVLTFYPGQTATDFGANAIGDLHIRQSLRPASPSQVDTPEAVAESILAAIEEEAPESDVTDRAHGASKP